jgi:hypothetical protein
MLYIAYLYLSVISGISGLRQEYHNNPTLFKISDRKPAKIQKDKYYQFSAKKDEIASE